MMNCQFGIGFTLFLFLLLLIFYYLIALISSTILSVENDFCANLEEIVLREVSPLPILDAFIVLLQNSDDNLDTLLKYYFTNRGTVRSVLLEAFELDFADMKAEARSSSNEARIIIDDWGTKGEVTQL